MSRRQPIERAVARILENSRLDQNFSQADVAARARVAGYDVTQSKVSRALRGTTTMNLTDAQGIAAALGLRLSTVLAIAEGEVVASVDSMDVSELDTDPESSGGPRRKPRPVTVPPPEA